MKIAVIGSREFNDYSLLSKTLDSLNVPIECIISGGAPGADSLAEEYANEMRYPMRVIRPVWKVNGKYNPKAGFERNSLIIEESDIVVAFWNGVSRGTKDALDKAFSMGKKRVIIYF